jgi:hypothetical protein
MSTETKALTQAEFDRLWGDAIVTTHEAVRRLADLVMLADASNLKVKASTQFVDKLRAIGAGQLHVKFFDLPSNMVTRMRLIPLDKQEQLDEVEVVQFPIKLNEVGDPEVFRADIRGCSKLVDQLFTPGGHLRTRAEQAEYLVQNAPSKRARPLMKETRNIDLARKRPAYIRIRKGRAYRQEEVVKDEVILDFDSKGNLLGIEIV